VWFKSRCRRRKLLPRNDFSVVWARSTAVAVPPGKRNGWEHQDLRRRHLLKSQIENVPRTPISAVARPLEEHSTLVWRIHQWFSRVFLVRFPRRAPATIFKLTKGLGLVRLAIPREELAIRCELVLAFGPDAARRNACGGIGR
jgi:hypothetical protein